MGIKSPVGFLDSGIGGLTISSEVIRLLPGENIIYYGDNAHFPYGPRLQWEVRDFALRIIDYLVNECDAKYIVVACNTASVAAIDVASEVFSVPIIGPITEGAKEAVQSSKNQKIGLIATEGTVSSQGYQNAIYKLNPDAEVVAHATPKLVDIVEKGQLSDLETEGILREYLTPFINTGCDSLILGCTHFPFLMETIKKVIEGKMNVIFPGTEIAERIKRDLADTGLLNPDKKGDEIYLTSQLSNVSKDFLKIGRERLGMNLDFQELNLFE
ncbi:MAG: glutamate racemase [Halanaerobiales bacterium]|nr:glutamate racemase [Halanaerobiales bacterium]